MTDHELAQLDYQRVITLFGHARAELRPNDIVLIAGAYGSQPVAEPGPMKSTEYVIAARVVELSGDSKRLKTINVHKFFPSGASVSFSGEEWTDVEYFASSVEEQIADQRRIFENF